MIQPTITSTPHYESANNLKLATNNLENMGTGLELQPSINKSNTSNAKPQA